MNKRFLVFMLFGLILTEATQAAIMGGGSAGAGSSASPRRSPRRGTPQTAPSTITHTTPLTPSHGGRNLSTRTKKKPRMNRLQFDRAMTEVLDASLTRAPLINGRMHLNGVLLSEQRVAYNYPYNLRPRVTSYRSTSPNTCGGNGNALGKKQKNVFQHVVPLKTILDVIKQGEAFTFAKDGKVFLEIICDAQLLSNDPVIQSWLADYSEIRLTFGYPHDSLETTNPFLLFHARGEKISTRNRDLVPAIGAYPYIDETVCSDGPVLRFHLP